jgi:hypothetical protein
MSLKHCSRTTPATGKLFPLTTQPDLLRLRFSSARRRFLSIGGGTIAEIQAGAAMTRPLQQLDLVPKAA